MSRVKVIWIFLNTAVNLISVVFDELLQSIDDVEVAVFVVVTDVAWNGQLTVYYRKRLNCSSIAN